MFSSVYSHCNSLTTSAATALATVATFHSYDPCKSSKTTAGFDLFVFAFSIFSARVFSASIASLSS